jgi:hypothetical protein
MVVPRGSISPVNDLKGTDLIEQSIVGEKRQLVLKAECSDPEIVTEAFAFSNDCGKVRTLASSFRTWM